MKNSSNRYIFAMLVACAGSSVHALWIDELAANPDLHKQVREEMAADVAAGAELACAYADSLGEHVAVPAVEAALLCAEGYVKYVEAPVVKAVLRRAEDYKALAVGAYSLGRDYVVAPAWKRSKRWRKFFMLEAAPVIASIATSVKAAAAATIARTKKCYGEVVDLRDKTYLESRVPKLQAQVAKLQAELDALPATATQEQKNELTERLQEKTNQLEKAKTELEETSNRVNAAAINLQKHQAAEQTAALKAKRVKIAGATALAVAAGYGIYRGVNYLRNRNAEQTQEESFVGA